MHKIACLLFATTVACAPTLKPIVLKDKGFFINKHTKQPLLWSKKRLPLTIAIDETKVHPALIRLIAVAATMLNEQIGCRVFKTIIPYWAPSKLTKDIPVTTARLIQPIGAWVQHLLTEPDRKYIGEALITINVNRLPENPRYFVILMMHELGHVLGLRHDPDLPMSLMHPTLLHLNQKLTKKDILRLNTQYCK